ncbi:MAG: sulfite exporter TauE/SafE family protein [Taibaiella sp.]|jgi:uncharacterized membrane protein YfcA
MFELICLLLLGMVAGTLAGLLGVGGGVIIVPVLAWVFLAYPDIPSIHLMHVVLGTSLATIVFTSLSSIWAHHQRGAIYWPIVRQLTPGLVLGAICGVVVASYLSSNTLKIVFSIFLLLIAAQLGFGAQPTPQRKLPKGYAAAFISFLIGKISALVGIAGGSLIVPFLIWCNVPIRNAVATSAACGLSIALVGALGYIVIGWQENIAWSTGYVYWPAVLAIVPTSLLFAPVGAKLAHSIPTNVLKRFFAVLLSIIGLGMML